MRRLALGLLLLAGVAWGQSTQTKVPPGWYHDEYVTLPYCSAEITYGCIWRDTPKPKPGPFDETPQEWATYEWVPQNPCDVHGTCFAIVMPPKLEAFMHYGCADPRRVLLTSEDGVRHCFDFDRLK